MTTLKHLALAAMAFLLSAAAFLHFLQTFLPPSQVLASSRAEAVRQESVRRPAGHTASPTMNGEPAAPGQQTEQNLPDATAATIRGFAEQALRGVAGVPEGADAARIGKVLEGLDPAQLEQLVRAWQEGRQPSRTDAGATQVPPR
jgi:hypothetical protein